MGFYLNDSNWITENIENTMSDVKLGQLATPESKRDAIHIALAPVTACSVLAPGE